MPFLLDMSSRVIEFVDRIPDDWLSVKIRIKRLLNDQNPHAIDWEDATIAGKAKGNLIILSDRLDAFDIEYWTRGGGTLNFEEGHQRVPVDYSDLDFPDISDDMYRANLLRQYPHLEPDMTTSEMELITNIYEV
jgi:hypothetical protein